MSTATSKSTLVLVFEGIEEVEALMPVDILRRAGVHVVVASLDDSDSVTGRNGIIITPDTHFSRVSPHHFDLIYLPGGPGVLPLAKHLTLRALLRQQHEDGKLIAALCAAPSVLAAEGLLDDISATAHISVRADLPNPSQDRVVVDHKIITSQGLGTALEFSLELVKQLIDDTAALEVAKSIHN
tara:strand:- start:72 stop:623 length:552 start_codon:yes stop_codon:yes gene_type:complete